MNRKLQNPSKEFLKNEFNKLGILIEKNSSDIKLLAEGLSNVYQVATRTEEQVLVLTEKVAVLDDKVNNLETKVTTIEQKLQIVEQDVHIIKNTMATKSDLAVFDARITKIEQETFA